MANYPRASPARWWKTRSIGKPHRSPHAMFVGRTRWWASLLLLALLALVVGAGWYLANPRRISQMAGILLSRVLDGHVTVRTGRISLAGTIRLSGVRMRTRHGHGPAATIFSADKVDVRFNWLSLLSGRLRASQIIAVHPVLNLVDDRDTGRWNYQSFLHFHHTSPVNSAPAGTTSVVASAGVRHLPSIDLRSAVIRWGRMKNHHYSITGQSVIDAQLGPVPGHHSVYRMEIQEHSPAGRIGVEISGRWNLPAHSLHAFIPRLVLDPAFRRTLPSALQRWWRRFKFHGELRDIALAVGPVRGIEISGTLDNVSMRFAVPSRRLGPQIVPISHLNGKVNVGSGATSISGLTGNILGYAFVVPHAAFDGYASGSPFDVQLKLPGFDLPRKYPAILSTRPLAMARAIVYRLRPSGLMDISIHAVRASAGAVPHVQGQILCHGLRARYAHFPYPFYDVHGLIRFSSHSIRFVHLSGKAEQYPMTLSGLVSINEDNGPIDLHIASPLMMFDKRLGACLPHDLAPIWTRFNPVGMGHFYCHVVRPAGSTVNPDIRIHIFATDTAGRYVDFPYPLTHVHGELFFANRKMRILRLVAPVAIPHPTPGGPKEGQIVFTGSVTYHGNNVADLHPHVRVVATDIPMNKLLRQSMPRSYAKWIRTFHVHGLVGMNALITRGTGGTPSVSGGISLDDGSLRYGAIPWPVRNVVMRGDMGPNHLTITRLDGLTGINNTGGLKCVAAVRESGNHRIAAAISGRWKGVDVTGTPAARLPVKWRKIWTMLRPSGHSDGTFSMAIKVRRNKSGKSVVTIPKYHVSIKPKDMALRFKTLGEPLRKIHGVITVGASVIRLHSMAALLGNIRLFTTGKYLTKTGAAELSLSASAPDMDPKLIQALPPAARRFVQPLGLHGAWNLMLSSLSRKMVKNKAHWDFSGNLIVNHASSGGWFKTVAANAALSLAGQWIQGQSVPNVIGQFSVNNLVMNGKMITPLTGRIATDALTRSIVIDDVKGMIAGGDIGGYVHMNVGKAPGYAARFSLTNVHLATLLSQNYPKPPVATTSRGTVNASLDLRGLFTSSKTRQGRGSLTISNASLFNVPLAMGLLQIATLRFPVSNAFTYAGITYTLRHNTVDFSHIELHSSGVNVVGRGTLDMGTRKLNIHMLTESPHGTRLPVIGFFFGLARSQLLQIRVDGTLAQPHVHVIPLKLLIWPFH